MRSILIPIFGPAAAAILLVASLPGFCVWPAGAVAQTPEPPTPSELAMELFAESNLPNIQLRGRFEFFSAYDRAALEPSSSAEFTGEIDLATRVTHFDFQRYKSPVADQEPQEHASYAVAFDGDKWTEVDGGSKTSALPQGIAALGSITKVRPMPFLKSLDPLCFPLFAPLLIVQNGFEAASLRDVLAGKGPRAKLETTLDGTLLRLTIKREGVSDEFTFDTAKNNLLTHRQTDFGRPWRQGDNWVINELTISDSIPAGEQWFPAAAEMTQTVNGRVLLRRVYTISEVKELPSSAVIGMVIPPNVYVRDERTHTTYTTGSASPPVAMPGKD